MFVDQNEIEALLAQADDLRAEAEEELKTRTKPTAQGQPATPARGGPKPRPGPLPRHLSPEIKRILRLRVPVIVQLASRHMPLAKIRRLSAGAIIEFDKAVEGDLDLYIRNHHIGTGHAVKIGEHFGLRVTSIGTRAERIASLGPQ